ncbi:hypothetical protein BaRGS_00026122 [Batillaria attramentaria]|uniref:Uncharacterized protein n=1 Tax=Batillaria attramentaria TaxID=370345 RepID=A0ABD0K6W7_9CAEN
MGAEVKSVQHRTGNKSLLGDTGNTGRFCERQRQCRERDLTSKTQRSKLTTPDCVQRAPNFPHRIIGVQADEVGLSGRRQDVILTL